MERSIEDSFYICNIQDVAVGQFNEGRATMFDVFVFDEAQNVFFSKGRWKVPFTECESDLEKIVIDTYFNPKGESYFDIHESYRFIEEEPKTAFDLYDLAFEDTVEEEYSRYNTREEFITYVFDCADGVDYPKPTLETVEKIADAAIHRDLYAARCDGYKAEAKKWEALLAGCKTRHPLGDETISGYRDLHDSIAFDLNSITL